MDASFTYGIRMVSCRIVSVSFCIMVSILSLSIDVVSLGYVVVGSGVSQAITLVNNTTSTIITAFIIDIFCE